MELFHDTLCCWLFNSLFNERAGRGHGMQSSLPGELSWIASTVPAHSTGGCNVYVEILNVAAVNILLVSGKIVHAFFS